VYLFCIFFSFFYLFLLFGVAVFVSVFPIWRAGYKFKVELPGKFILFRFMIIYSEYYIMMKTFNAGMCT